MKAKKVFEIFLVLLTTGFIGCSDKNDDIDDVSLEYTALYASAISVTYEIPITAGSGDYSAIIDDDEIADVKTEKQKSGYVLIIYTKKEGDTFLTLTDNKTGKSIICSVFIKINRLKITSIGYGVDADQKETILEELKENEPFPVGSHIIINPLPLGTNFSPGMTGTWMVYSADGNKIAQEPYVAEKTESFPAYMFELLPIEKQILTHSTLKVGDNEKIYHLVVVKHGASRDQDMAYLVIYEDLTDQYKAVQPDLGVNAVVRAYTYNPWDDK